MKLPVARGPVSAALIDVLSGRGNELPSVGVPADVLGDEDLQLALFVCYELHYRGWDGVDDRWEWDADVLRLRAAAERRFETALRELAGPPPPVDPASVPARLAELVASDDGPSLSGYLRGRATYEQFR
jgi:hypothetical protein